MGRIALFAICLGLAVPLAAQEAADPPPLPQPRPENLGQETPAEAEDVPAEEEAVEDEEEEPRGELPRVYQAACPALLDGTIEGEIVPPLSEGTCGQTTPIAISAIRVNGRTVSLPETPVTSCAMATAFADWAREVDSYARATLDTGLAALSTGPGYQCRLRNGADTGFVSEHGLANALDIAALAFEDGRTIRVETDWQTRPASPEARFLTQAHGAACARFTTVLGPQANADHADHFHFDLGCHGQSCTARICQ